MIYPLAQGSFLHRRYKIFQQSCYGRIYMYEASRNRKNPVFFSKTEMAWREDNNIAEVVAKWMAFKVVRTIATALR